MTKTSSKWSIMGTWSPIWGSRTLFPQQAKNHLPHRRRNKQFRWERRRVGQAFELGGGPVYGQYDIDLDPETGRIIGFFLSASVHNGAPPTPFHIALILSTPSFRFGHLPGTPGMHTP